MTIAISLMTACTNKNEIKTVDAKQFKIEIEKLISIPILKVSNMKNST